MYRPSDGTPSVPHVFYDSVSGPPPMVELRLVNSVGGSKGPPTVMTVFAAAGLMQ